MTIEEKITNLLQTKWMGDREISLIVNDILALISDSNQQAVEKVKGLYKHLGHTDHSDKDEWYDCFKCMDDANLDRVIDSLKGDTEEHEWFVFKQDKFRCCKKCGIIERRDGKNGKCSGEVKLELRTPTKESK